MIGVPLAQYAGFGAAVQIGSSSQVRVVNRLLSDAEIQALNATPITIMSGIPNRFLIPISWHIRVVKPGAAAWGTSPTLSLIHEGNTTALNQTNTAAGLNTAAAMDQLDLQMDVNTAVFNLLTFNRVGLGVQVRSTIAPVKGGGSDATIMVTAVIYIAKVA